MDFVSTQVTVTLPEPKPPKPKRVARVRDLIPGLT